MKKVLFYIVSLILLTFAIAMGILWAKELSEAKPSVSKPSIFSADDTIIMSTKKGKQSSVIRMENSSGNDVIVIQDGDTSTLIINGKRVK